jgi:hypothetical protein
VSLGWLYLPALVCHYCRDSETQWVGARISALVQTGRGPTQPPVR